MYTLRPYQQEAKEANLAEWAEGRRRTLLVLPTGCGKTICFASVIEHEIQDGSRALVLAHLGELLTQAADKLRDACGIESALEKAGSSSLGSGLPVTVGSVQSLGRVERLDRFPEDRKASVEMAYNYCSFELPVSLESMAEYMGVSIRCARDRIKECGNEYTIKGGYVVKAEKAGSTEIGK